MNLFQKSGHGRLFDGHGKFQFTPFYYLTNYIVQVHVCFKILFGLEIKEKYFILFHCYKQISGSP